MKGDFSRFTNKYYNRVLKQQGRVDLDSDWNEYVEGQEYADRKKTKDIIGDCGVPTEDAGFAITSKNDFSRHLRAVQFQGAGRGWAVATNGVILATTDGGRTWFAQESGVSDLLNGLYFVDGRIGWAVGRPGVILATQNGGDTWETQVSGVTNVLHAVHFVDDLHGWAVGAGGTILATVDGGRQWLRKTSDTTEDLLSVYFLDEKTGWAVGKQGVVLNTTDSGDSWLEQASGVDVDLHSVRFVNESLGWSVGISGVILHTTNKGGVWTKQASGTESPLFDVCFTDELTGWVVGTTGLILHTTTGGSSWTEQESSVAKHLWAVHFLDERIGWAVGDRETIIGTEDGGLTWEHVSLNLGIGKGRAYINGILCEAEQEVTYITQPSYPDPPSIHPLTANQTTRTDLVYLDVWQRHITAIEDPSIREVALGGPDTATRVKTLWQVKIKKDVEEDTACNADIAGWPPADTGALLSTKAEPEAIEQKPCTVSLGAGYSGLENRLYRVEIHDEGELYTWPRPDIPDSDLLEDVSLDPNNQQIILAEPLESVSEWLGRMVEVFSHETEQAGRTGPAGRITAIADDRLTLSVDADLLELEGHTEFTVRKVATFKWSRDNGSVALAIDEFLTEDSEPTNKAKISGYGRDPASALEAGDWVEISDDASELYLYPGTLAKIIDPVDAATGIVTLDRVISGYSLKSHPKLRRWDQEIEAIPVTGSYKYLEQGIQAELSGNNFKTGDYWTFSARVNNGHIDELDSEPPHGVAHHYCRLALVTWKYDGKAEVEDCRNIFSPLTEIKNTAGCCTVTVGDGVTSVGDFSELQAAIDALEEGGTVCVLPGEYQLQSTVILNGKDIVIKGCGSASWIILPENASAFDINGGTVRLESLRIAPKHKIGQVGAIVANSVKRLQLQGCTIIARSPQRAAVDVRGVERALHIQGCTITNHPLMGPAILGPVCHVADGKQVIISDNDFFGSPGLAIQACCAEISDNRLRRGGIWVGEGSTEISVEGNIIEGENLVTRVGYGPGILLGGLPAGFELLAEVAGIRTVTILGNEIRRRTGSGISTSAQVDEDLNLGGIGDLTIALNRITECAVLGPDPIYEGTAVGGIVLRHVDGLRIHNNQIRDNGTGGDVAACGIFLHSCAGVEVMNNQVLDNGSRSRELFRSVDFRDLNPGENKNPLWVGDVEFSVFEPSEELSENIYIEGSDPPNPPPLRCGVRTEIQLPSSVSRAWLLLMCLGISKPIRIEALDENRDQVSSLDLTPDSGVLSGVFPVQLAGEEIRRVVVHVSEDQVGNPGEAKGVLLSNVAFGEPGYQAGIAAFYVNGHEVSGSQATRIHDNTVACPRGQALVAHGLGPMSIGGNHFVSLGPRTQPPLSARMESGQLDPEELVSTFTQLGPCIFLLDLGSNPNLSETTVGFGLSASGHLRAGDFAGATIADESSDGRVLFHGNQVTLELATEGVQLLTSTFVASFDDVSMQDNQFVVRAIEGGVISDVMAAGLTLRVSNNRFTERQDRAVFSCISAGVWNVTADNQGSHCISPVGGEVVDRDNHVIFPTGWCDLSMVGGYVVVPNREI